MAWNVLLRVMFDKELGSVAAVFLSWPSNCWYLALADIVGNSVSGMAVVQAFAECSLQLKCGIVLVGNIIK